MKWELTTKEDLYEYERNPWWKAWLISDKFTTKRHIVYCRVTLTPLEKAIVDRSDLGELEVFKETYEYWDSYYGDRKQLQVKTSRLRNMIDFDLPIMHLYQRSSIEPKLDQFHKRLEEVAGIIKAYTEKPNFTRKGEA
jgi:hypothetical protein